MIAEGEQYMATMVNSGGMVAERIFTIADFVERVYLPWVEQYERPSTVKGYRDVWQDHLKPRCGKGWLKNTRTYHVQAERNRENREAEPDRAEAHQE